MGNTTKSIKLIELTPYGSFPVGSSRTASNDLQSLMSSLSLSDNDEAKFWFENDEVEVA